MDLRQEEQVCNVNTLCRTCRQVLLSDALDIKHDIFLTPDLDKKLILCTSLSVEPQDGCPKYLCEDCYSKVVEFYQFQTMCVESAKFFNELLQLLSFEEVFEDEQPICELLEITVLPTYDDSVLLEMDTEYCHKEESSKRISVIVDEEVLSDHRDFNIENSYEEQEDEEVLSDHTDFDNENSNKEREEEEVLSDHIDFDIENSYKEQEDEEVLSDHTDFDNENSNKEREEKEVLSDHRDFDIKNSNKDQEFEEVQTSESHTDTIANPIKYVCMKPGLKHVSDLKTSLHIRLPTLANHPGETTNPGKYFCTQPDCNYTCKCKATLNNHLYKVHKVKSLVCEFCGEAFRDWKTFRVHQYRHKDVSERPFVCDTPDCELRFTSSGALNIHKLRHADIRKYVCPQCGLRKTTSSELKKHMNYHTRERTWPCRICKKVCNSANNLRVHERNEHGRAKDFECRFCEKTFVKSATLKYHEMSHTGEKPIVCTECGKRYLERHRLLMHMKKNHKDQLVTAKVTPTQSPKSKCS